LASKWLTLSLSEHESLSQFHAQVYESKELDEKMAFLISNSTNFLKTYRGNAELAIKQAEKSFDEVDQAKIEATEAILASKRLEASEEMDKGKEKRVVEFEIVPRILDGILGKVITDVIVDAKEDLVTVLEPSEAQRVNCCSWKTCQHHEGHRALALNP
jgi:hypothetical protein